MQHREQHSDTAGHIGNRTIIAPRLRRTITRPHDDDKRPRGAERSHSRTPDRDSDVVTRPHSPAPPIRRVNTSDATGRHTRPADSDSVSQRIDSHHHKNNTITSSAISHTASPPAHTHATTPAVDTAALGQLEIIKSGYIIVHPSLWDYLPAGAHVQFTEKSGRFNRGGFIKCHYIDSAGERALIINTTCRYKDRPANTAAPRACVPVSVQYQQIDTLWMKYDMSAFIEIHLIYNSLAQKKQQIVDLQARVTALEAALRARGVATQSHELTDSHVGRSTDSHVGRSTDSKHS